MCIGGITPSDEPQKRIIGGMVMAVQNENGGACNLSLDGTDSDNASC